MNALAYWNPTRRVIAEGALDRLSEELEPFGPKRALLVFGQSWLRASAHYGRLREQLAGCEIVEAPPIPSNPTVRCVEEAWTALRQAGRLDVVIGIGGGSVLDVAKMLALLLAQREGETEAFLAGRAPFRERPRPVVAIPTTSGTGSEVTPFASLVTPERNKVSIEHAWLFPAVALIDPLLTHSMSAYVTASTGFDALCQAVESFWSVRHTPFSETHALRATALVLEHLESAVRERTNREARCAMALGSAEAGLAISQTRTTAVHAVSYPLTARFGIPHGHACALTLAPFIRFNAGALTPRRAQLLWQTMGAGSSEEAARRVEQLMGRVGLDRSLSRLGVDEAGIETVIANGFRKDRVSNNPRALEPGDLREILQSIS